MCQTGGRKRVKRMSTPVAGPAAGLRPVLELGVRRHHPGVQRVDRHAAARACMVSIGTWVLGENASH